MVSTSRPTVSTPGGSMPSTETGTAPVYTVGGEYIGGPGHRRGSGPSMSVVALHTQSTSTLWGSRAQISPMENSGERRPRPSPC